MRTVMVQVVLARAQPALAIESTRGEPRQPGGPEDTSLGIAQVGCRDGQVGLPPLPLPTGKTQMPAKVVPAIHPLCSPCPLATIFLA